MSRKVKAEMWWDVGQGALEIAAARRSRERPGGEFFIARLYLTFESIQRFSCGKAVPLWLSSPGLRVMGD